MVEAINASEKRTEPKKKQNVNNIQKVEPMPPEPLPAEVIVEEAKNNDNEGPKNRVDLQMGDILKSRLDVDYQYIVKQNKLHSLPAKMPVIVILENFVRYYAIKQLCGVTNVQEKPKRKYSHSKYEKQTCNREAILQHMITNIELTKEVADGLRIYFDFTIKDYLLYSQEVKQADCYLSPEYLKKFRYTVPENV